MRHGVTTLFAAFNTAGGTAITSVHRRAPFHLRTWALENDIRTSIAAGNDNLRPCVWTKIVDQILHSSAYQ